MFRAFLRAPAPRSERAALGQPRDVGRRSRRRSSAMASRRGARIVLLSSVAGLRAIPGLAAYGMSKAASRSFARCSRWSSRRTASASTRSRPGATLTERTRQSSGLRRRLGRERRRPAPWPRSATSPASCASCSAPAGAPPQRADARGGRRLDGHRPDAAGLLARGHHPAQHHRQDAAVAQVLDARPASRRGPAPRRCASVPSSAVASTVTRLARLDVGDAADRERLAAVEAERGGRLAVGGTAAAARPCPTRLERWMRS